MMHTHDFIMSVLMSLTKQAKTLTKLQIKLITWSYALKLVTA